jgi:hypothetical protein
METLEFVSVLLAIFGGAGFVFAISYAMTEESPSLTVIIPIVILSSVTLVSGLSVGAVVSKMTTSKEITFTEPIRAVIDADTIPDCHHFTEWDVVYDVERQIEVQYKEHLYIVLDMEIVNGDCAVVRANGFAHAGHCPHKSHK